jgi:hypothetical protein
LTPRFHQSSPATAAVGRPAVEVDHSLAGAWATRSWPSIGPPPVKRNSIKLRLAIGSVFVRETADVGRPQPRRPLGAAIPSPRSVSGGGLHDSTPTGNRASTRHSYGGRRVAVGSWPCRPPPRMLHPLWGAGSDCGKRTPTPWSYRRCGSGQWRPARRPTRLRDQPSRDVRAEQP